MSKKCFSLNSIREMEVRGYCMARQPIVTGNIHDAPQLAGYELLARHKRAQFPARTPGQFMSRLSTDHLATIDALALRSAIDEIIATQGHNTFVTFNCSILNLTRVDFVDYASLRIAALPASDRSRLVVEITETERVGDKKLASGWSLLRRNVDRLTASGARIAIDDFGCGNACLRLARNLPVSFIKYSKNVLDDCIAADADRPTRQDLMNIDLMRSIGSTMRGWGCDVIVEGLESASQISAAFDLGGNYFQGFMFGAPSLSTALPEGDHNRMAAG